MVWASDTDLVNTALAYINAEQINDIGDGSPAAMAAIPILPMVKAVTIGRHPWRFCAKRALLSRLEDSGDANLWSKKYRFEKPSWLVGTTFRIIKLGDEHCVPLWEEAGKYIYSDETDLIIEGNYDVPVSEYPAYFCDFISHVLAARFAEIIMQDVGMAQNENVKAYGTQDERGDNGLLRIARELDGLARPTKSLKFDLGMTNGRRGGW